MYDLTWAAGYINNNTFTKKFSTIYYRVLPAELIKSHMPFDPMYQFMNYTLSNKEFIEGKNTTKAKLVFNFADTLQQYGLLSKDDKVISEARRIKSNGIENDVIQSRLDYLDKQKEAFSSKNGYQQAMDLYGRAVTLFNQYIALKNQQFNTVKEEKEIKQMVDSMSYYISESWSLLGTVVATRPENRQAVAGAYQSLEKFQNQVNKEKEFVTAYLGAGKSSRSQLFLTNRH